MLISTYLLFLILTFTCHFTSATQYEKGSEFVTHEDAVKWCESRGMKLVTFETKEKLDEVYKFLEEFEFWLWEPDPTHIHFGAVKTSSYWSAGKFNNDSQRWNWADGTPVTYHNWMPGRPINYQCLEIFTIGNCTELFWGDEDCNSLKQPICEGVNNKTEVVADACFYFGQDSLTFFEAHQFCQQLDMQMLSIRDAEKNAVVNMALKNAGRAQGSFKGKSLPEVYWTSGNNLKYHNAFQWLNGYWVNYSNWAEVDYKPSCILFIPGETNQWYSDRDCNDKFYFICELINKPNMDRILPKVYHISKTKATYFRAIKLCYLQGMQLVGIQDRDKNRVLLDHIPNGNDLYWTSGSKVRGEGNWWIWRRSTVVRYNNFDKEHFDKFVDKELNCIAILKSDEIVWNIDYCENEHKFICESGFPPVNLHCIRH